jgi:hypothetical protein
VLQGRENEVVRVKDGIMDGDAGLRRQALGGLTKPAGDEAVGAALITPAQNLLLPRNPGLRSPAPMQV